jgi:hypothetical protein
MRACYLRLGCFEWNTASTSMRIQDSVQLPWFHHPNYIQWKAKLWSSSLYNFLQPPVTSGPRLRSSDQSSWLQIQRSGFDSRCYQVFWEVVGLERGPLSLVSTIVELLERKSSGSGLENREYCRRDQSRWPRGTLYPQKLAITSPTSGGRSIGRVRYRTQATEGFFSSYFLLLRLPILSSHSVPKHQ